MRTAQKPLLPAEQLKDLHFPRAGLDVSQAFLRQPNRPIGDQAKGNAQVWSRTTPAATNVRGYEATSGRSRGGSRPGLARWHPAKVSGTTFVVQDLSLLVGSGYDPPGGGTVQTSQSGRVVTVVAVSQGNVYVANAGDTAWTQPTNNTGETPPLNYTGLMFSSANNQKLYFADGINWVYYDPFTNTLNTWAATAGTLPEDSDGNLPRLICTWRGRTVLSGLLLDPQNWFMSAVSDPTDFDYAPTSPSPTDAVAGNNGPLGFIGDVVTALVPYTDDILIFGGDHTVYMMRGDPLAGGQIDLVSDGIGFAWGQAWCRDPDGTLYFFSNRCGVFAMVPGQRLEPISLAVQQPMQSIDTGANSIRMIWDDRYKGAHLFVTPLDEPAASTHWFWEQRSGAWWQDEFANHDHDPLCCCTFDGNSPTDRVPLVGSWDGYVRTLDPDATRDDGTAIASEVVIGPLNTPNLDDLLFKDLQAVLAAESGAVTYEVLVGTSAEDALAQSAVVTGTWQPGRNLNDHVRRAGHALYLRLRSTVPWSLEAVRVRIEAMNKVRMRGR